MAQKEGKKLQIVKLNYETVNGGNWSAQILAFSAKEAVEFTKRVLGKNFYSTREISTAAEVDAISTEVQEFLKKETKTKDQEPTLLCPWCDKTFDSRHGLKVHLSKSCKKPVEKTEEKVEEPQS